MEKRKLEAESGEDVYQKRLKMAQALDVYQKRLKKAQASTEQAVTEPSVPQQAITEEVQVKRESRDDDGLIKTHSSFHAGVPMFPNTSFRGGLDIPPRTSLPVTFTPTSTPPAPSVLDSQQPVTFGRPASMPPAPSTAFFTQPERSSTPTVSAFCRGTLVREPSSEKDAEELEALQSATIAAAEARSAHPLPQTNKPAFPKYSVNSTAALPASNKPQEAEELVALQSATIAAAEARSAYPHPLSNKPATAESSVNTMAAMPTSNKPPRYFQLSSESAAAAHRMRDDWARTKGVFSPILAATTQQHPVQPLSVADEIGTLGRQFLRELSEAPAVQPSTSAHPTHLSNTTPQSSPVPAPPKTAGQQYAELITPLLPAMPNKALRQKLRDISILAAAMDDEELWQRGNDTGVGGWAREINDAFDFLEQQRRRSESFRATVFTHDCEKKELFERVYTLINGRVGM